MNDPWKDYGLPTPGEMVRVDYARKEINLAVLIVGSTAEATIHQIFEATKGPNSQFISHSSPGARMITYLPMSLGDIRGYKTRLHLYALAADRELTNTIALTAPAAAGAILAFAGGTHRGTEGAFVLQLLATALQPTAPVAALGDAELAAAWQATAGRAAMHTPDGAFHALKAVSKEMLTQLRQSPG